MLVAENEDLFVLIQVIPLCFPCTIPAAICQKRAQRPNMQILQIINSLRSLSGALPVSCFYPTTRITILQATLSLRAPKWKQEPRNKPRRVFMMILRRDAHVLPIEQEAIICRIPSADTPSSAN